MLDRSTLEAALKHTLREVDVPGWPAPERGKVRDAFVLPKSRRRVLVTTDRVSAFDRVIGLIPFKGQVLNQLSAFWFESTRDIVPNHLVSLPDPNALLARDAAPLPVEVVVRGYLTGVTSTSLWTLYEQGVERPYGLDLPAGMTKDSPLAQAVITPTTKATGGAHDERLTCDEVLEKGLVAPDLWAQTCEAALALFARGTDIAREQGLLLVDTKYEFGLIDGALHLIDEVHTPDSSRYWLADSYAQARADGVPPTHLDKERLRKWLKTQKYDGEGPPPALPTEVAVDLAQTYIEIYERLTQREFEPGALPAAPRVAKALAALKEA